MAISLSDLLKPQTADDVMSTFLNVAAQLGLPVTAWQKLGVGRSILRTVAQKVADLTAIVAAITAGGFLDYAAAVTPEGGPGYLDLLVRNVYSIDREAASFARGPITLVNASGTTYTINPGDLHFANTLTGKTFSNVNAVTLAASSTLPATDPGALVLIADAPGAASTSAAGDITTMVTPLTGVTCTNPTSLVGNDVETNTDLVSRARAQLKSVSPNGPPDAFNFAARNSLRPDGSIVQVNRSRPVASGFGDVALYVAGPNGPIDSGDLPYVDANALLYLPLDGSVEVINAAAHAIVVTGVITVTVASQLTDAQVIAAAEAQILAFFARVAIGGYAGVLPNESIRGQIAISLGGAFISCSLSSPAADTSLASNAVPTFDPSSSFTVARF